MVPACGYNPEGISDIRLLDFEDFKGFKFRGDKPCDTCDVTAVNHTGGFIVMESPDTAKYSSTLQNGVYTHVLESFIGELSAGMSATLHLATKRRYIVMFRSKTERYFAFAYEAGATVTYVNRTDGGTGSLVTVTASSIHPLFEMSRSAFMETGYGNVIIGKI
jgi:hypothetical protein